MTVGDPYHTSHSLYEVLETPFPTVLTEKPQAPLHDSVRILLSEVRETGSTVLGMRDTRGTLQLTQGSMLRPP